MSKPVILTGLRANNDLHIGNYLGALLPLIDMAIKKAGECQVNLFVPDLHSVTTPIDHTQLQAQVMQNVRVFVAAGLRLDHDDVHIYRQSFVPAHSELTWILDCFTGFGEMSRMTQFKDKAGKHVVPEITQEEQRLINILGGIASNKSESANLESIHAHAIIRAFQDRTIFVSNDRISVGLFNYPVLMAADILLYDALTVNMYVIVV